MAAARSYSVRTDFSGIFEWLLVVVSKSVINIYTVGDYKIGMTTWPVTATIPKLNGIPYTNEISLHLSSEASDGGIPPTQIIKGLMLKFLP
mgnify:CR=1 FL=1